MADYISRNQMVPIREFLENYCSLRCNWKEKMTHKRMTEFLTMKGKNVSRGRFGDITKEQKLTGEYLYVEDEVGKIIPYKNPGMEFRKLQISLMLGSNPEKLREIRSKYLEEERLTYDEFGNVITIEEKEARRRLALELEEEEKQNRLLDEEYAYYEKMSDRNRHQKTKTYYIRRK